MSTTAVNTVGTAVKKEHLGTRTFENKRNLTEATHAGIAGNDSFTGHIRLFALFLFNSKHFRLFSYKFLKKNFQNILENSSLSFSPFFHRNSHCPLFSRLVLSRGGEFSTFYYLRQAFSFSTNHLLSGEYIRQKFLT